MGVNIDYKCTVTYGSAQQVHLGYHTVHRTFLVPSLNQKVGYWGNFTILKQVEKNY